MAPFGVNCCVIWFMRIKIRKSEPIGKLILYDKHFLLLYWRPYWSLQFPMMIAFRWYFWTTSCFILVINSGKWTCPLSMNRWPILRLVLLRHQHVTSCRSSMKATSEESVWGSTFLQNFRILRYYRSMSISYYRSIRYNYPCRPQSWTDGQTDKQTLVSWGGWGWSYFPY